MKQETIDATSDATAATETESPATTDGLEPGPAADSHPLEARALVEKMIEAGELPEPELLEQIVAAGDAAVEPLLAILRSKPQGWPDEASLSHALGVLQLIRHPSAIPEIVEIIRNYPEDAGSEAVDALACYGEDSFEATLSLAADPAVRDYPRSHAILAAQRGAGANPMLRARLGDVIRPILQDLIERELRSRANPPEAYHPSENDFEMDIYDEISLLVNVLAGIADPLARDLIQSVLDEELYDPYSVDAKAIEKRYESGGEREWPPPDWLADYRESYDLFTAMKTRVNAPSARLGPISRQTELAPSAPSKAVVPVTIRNKEQPVGRNDPCWCGSGKKYKKCHLGKDTTV